MTPPGGKPAPETNGHFDLDAAAAAALAEALGRPFRFTYKGGLYELPNQQTWPLSALQALNDEGDIERFLSDIGAKDQTYERLTAAGLCVGELKVLVEQASVDAGFGSLKNSGQPSPRGSLPR